jgi:hypothetical protein
MRKIPFAIVGLIFTLQSEAADPVVFQDWGSGMGNDKTFMFAVTVNDSGETFGEYCYFKAKACNWYVLLRSQCKPGTTTPILANSDSTAAPLTVTCFGQMPGTQLYSDRIDDWKALEGTLTDSIRIGFAIPLEADQFTVARFSLKGRTAATQAMEAAFTAQVGRGTPGQHGTEDQIL